MKLKDKVVLITGGGSGLGREMGLTFAREGAKVGVNDIKPESAQNVVTEIERAGGKARPFVADVSSSAAVAKMFAEFHRGVRHDRHPDQQRGHRAQPRDERGDADSRKDRRGLAQDARDASRLDLLLHARGAEGDDPEAGGPHHQYGIDRGHHGARVRVGLLRGEGRDHLVHQVGRARSGDDGDPGQLHRARIHRHADDLDHRRRRCASRSKR